MRRITFYLIVALLAFGIGSFIAVKFYYQPVEELYITNIKEEPKIIENKPTSNFVFDLDAKPFEQLEETDKEKVRLTCKDKILSFLWDHLLKDNDFREYADKQIDKNGFRNCSEIISILEKVDLNNDGKNEVIIGGKNWMLNGATGNVGTWIIQQKGKGYKILLEFSAEDYKIKKSKTNGYRDVFIKMHASCCSSWQATYKFQNGKYKEVKCLFVDYGITGEKSVITCAEDERRTEERLRESEKLLNK